jgi:outer membrane protein assembly factor BamB
VNILATVGAKNLTWGMSGSPLVVENKVVVNPGGEAKGSSVAAFDRANGNLVWTGGNSRAGYASPMLATLGGTLQILVFDGAGLAGYNPANGAELWRIEWTTQEGINVAQPLVLDGDRVFISSNYGVGCAMLKVQFTAGKWSCAPLWKNKRMRCKMASPVLHAGHLYGLDDGVLACLRVDTGERTWRAGRFGHGQILLTGNLIVVLAETGELILVEANPDRFVELGRIQAIDGKTWNYPALSNGHLFARNHHEMACYDLTGQSPEKETTAVRANAP